jgi:hypothetical protein|tara:strand:+ start:2631 stop:3191 length:561 start_codon:yes stop_codon:yes gene_type:complete
MAKLLDVIQGLAQAAANSYDGALDEDGKPIEIGLKREDKNMYKRNMADGFKVKFAGQQMIVTYHSEAMVKDLHPRSKYVNKVEGVYDDIIKHLKKEYKKITKSSVTLKAVAEAKVSFQSTSRVRSWVQSTKAYQIVAEADNTEELGKSSEEKIEDNIKKFMELSTDKRSPHDKAGNEHVSNLHSDS